MKHFTLFALTLLILASCNGGFNKSYHADGTTGMITKGNGLSCEEVFLTIDKERTTRTKFIVGEEVVVNFENVDGLKKIQDMQYPGAEMIIRNSKSEMVLHHKDLLADMKTDLDPLLVTTSFGVNFPHEENETFKLYVKIWDKKGSGVFTAEMPFTVVENKKMKIQHKGIESSVVYIWDQTESKALTNHEINRKNETYLLIQNVTGLQEVDGYVNPKIQLYCIDSKGNKLIDEPNLLPSIAQNGTQLEEKNQLPISLSFSKGRINNPLSIELIMTDLNSDKSMRILTSITVK